MKVILIHRDRNYSLIGVAKNVFSAITWLVNSNWLTGDFNVWSEEEQDYVPVKTIFTKDALVKMTREEFNVLFDGDFYLDEDILIDSENL